MHGMVFTTDGLTFMGQMNCRGAKRLHYCVNYCVSYCDTTVTHVVNSRMLAALRCAGQQAFRPHCASSIPG